MHHFLHSLTANHHLHPFKNLADVETSGEHRAYIHPALQLARAETTTIQATRHTRLCLPPSTPDIHRSKKRLKGRRAPHRTRLDRERTKPRYAPRLDHSRLDSRATASPTARPSLHCSFGGPSQRRMTGRRGVLTGLTAAAAGSASSSVETTGGRGRSAANHRHRQLRNVKTVSRQDKQH